MPLTRNEQIYDYINQGLQVVPWTTDRSKERHPLEGRYFRDGITIEEMRALLDSGSTCDVAIRPRAGIVCIDLDRHEGAPDGVEAFKQLCRDHGSSIEEATKGCAIGKSYSNGRHIWYRYNGGNARGFNSGLGIEVVYENHTVHCAPSAGYEWLTKQDFKIEKLPPLPKWLEAWWTSFQSKKPEEIVHFTKFANGSRHDSLMRFAGVARQRLNLSAPELRRLLTAVRDYRCERPHEVPDSEIDSIVTYLEDRPTTDFVGRLLSGDGLAQSIHTFVNGVKEEPTAPIVQSVPKIEFDSDLLAPNEIIGDWVTWSRECNPCDQPELTLMSVCAGLATLLGRIYKCHNVFGNQYQLHIVETSSGKEGVKRGVTEMITRMGHRDLLGGSTLGSDAGMIREITTRRSILWSLDEFPFMLRAMANPNAQTYTQMIPRLLMELSSCNSQEGKSLKEGTIQINDPYVNVIGFAQPKPFWSCITPAMIDSGFVGRFQVIPGRAFVPLKWDIKDIQCHGTPASLANFGEIISGEFASILAHHTGQSVVSRDIEESKEATLELRKVLDDINAFRKGIETSQDTILAGIVGREFERCCKLALIHAWSTDPIRPVLLPTSVKWAWEIILRCREYLKYGVGVQVHDTQYERNVNKVYDVIARSGTKGITQNELTRATQWCNSQDRGKLISTLIESDRIIEETVSNGNRPRTIFKALKDNDALT